MKVLKGKSGEWYRRAKSKNWFNGAFIKNMSLLLLLPQKDVVMHKKCVQFSQWQALVYKVCELLL